MVHHRTWRAFHFHGKAFYLLSVMLGRLTKCPGRRFFPFYLRGVNSGQNCVVRHYGVTQEEEQQAKQRELEQLKFFQSFRDQRLLQAQRECLYELIIAPTKK